MATGRGLRPELRNARSPHVQRVRLFDPATPGRTQPVTEIRIAMEPIERGSPGPGRSMQSRDSVLHDLAVCTYWRGDDRTPAGHRLNQLEAALAGRPRRFRQGH